MIVLPAAWKNKSATCSTTRASIQTTTHLEPCPATPSTESEPECEDAAESVEVLEEADDEEALSQLSAWDRRKRELLAEHGHPVEPLRSKSVKTPPQVIPKLDAADPDEDMDALHESIESINNIDAKEIEILKEQLTSKLRDAEVELSINRAKLSQQWASLEQRQYEISQREATFASKYGNLDGPTKKQGLLDRFSRHLSRKTDVDSGVKLYSLRVNCDSLGLLAFLFVLVWNPVVSRFCRQLVLSL